MRAKSWRAWTACELLRLEELRLEGHSEAAIAAALGRSVSSVHGRLTREGIAKPLNLAWLERFARPHTIAGLAAAHGVSRATVLYAKRRLRGAGIDVPAGQGRYPSCAAADDD